MKPAELLEMNGLLADRVRLAIMATLAASPEPVDFTTLVESLALTRGNLSTHMARLEEGNLVEVIKEFVNKKPRTSYRCTETGRREVEEYLRKIESVLALARGAKVG